MTALASLLLGKQGGKKNLQKNLGREAFGGEVEVALRVLLKLLWRAKIGPKTLFLKKFKKLFHFLLRRKSENAKDYKNIF